MKKLIFKSKVKRKKARSFIIDHLSFIAFLTLCLCVSVVNLQAQGTEFTYQGRLLDNSLPPTSNYDFEFSLWDALANGNQQGTTQTVTGVAIANGIFTVRLNFGAHFNGAARFLQIAVRPAGGGTYATLAPRQTITGVPYAIKSLNADNSTNAVNATTAGNVTGVVAIANGGTGSPTKNFVDLATNQTVGGTKNFTQSITAPSANFTSLTAGFASFVGLTTNNADPVSISGDLEVGNRLFADQFFGAGDNLTGVVLTSGGDQTIAGNKTFTNGISANSVSANTAGFGSMTASGNISIGGFVTLNIAPANLPQAPVCWTAFRLSGCTSSRRYKQDIQPLVSGLDFINRFRPVRYKWIGDGSPDLGLIAEEVAEVEPLLVTRNDKGEIQGVKYDRIGVIAVNAIKEQQTQIEAQKKIIDELQSQIASLKKLVCTQHPTAELCNLTEVKP